MNTSQKSTGQTGTRKLVFGRVGLIVLALAFVAGLSIVNVALHGVRLDLTENRLYTLSDGTKRILENIPEPVHVYLYFSDKATADIPYLRTYAGRVREMLQEFANRSGGKLTVRMVDPLPFSEDEDRAAQFGLRAVNIGNNPDPIYLGVAGTNSVGDDQVIPFLDPGKEAFLEYDLAKLVYTLANPKKPVVALLSSLPITAGFDPMTQQVRQPWAIVEQMRQLFDLRTLDPSIVKIDDEVKVLVVVHPKNLSDGALYAIDQFVMRGGRALFFVDPYAEIDRGDPADPSGMRGGRSSSLNKVLTPWGVSVDPHNAVLDDRYALTVGGADDRPIRHLGVIGVDQTGLAQDDVITSGLNMVNLAFAGTISKTKDSSVELTPLVRSSDLAGLVATDKLPMIQDPEMLRAGFAPGSERYVIAARLSGKVPSAFPSGPPGAGEKPAGHLASSAESINVVVVADTDLLADRLWIQPQQFFGQRVNSAFANNGDFVVNAIDNLLGSSDLISIRSRATFSRPFQRVQDLRRDAESRFRETQQGLQDELRDAEAKLAELQASRKDQGATILTKEQQAEIQRFQARRMEIRKELRQVQRNLDQKIDNLGSVLKAINIALVPVIISIVSLVLWYLRRRPGRRKAAGGPA